MDSTRELLKHLNQQRGSKIHVGPWLTVSQERTDAFAQVIEIEGEEKPACNP